MSGRRARSGSSGVRGRHAARRGQVDLAAHTTRRTAVGTIRLQSSRGGGSRAAPSRHLNHSHVPAPRLRGSETALKETWLCRVTRPLDFCHISFIYSSCRRSLLATNKRLHLHPRYFESTSYFKAVVSKMQNAKGEKPVHASSTTSAPSPSPSPVPRPGEAYGSSALAEVAVSRRLPCR